MTKTRKVGTFPISMLIGAPVVTIDANANVLAVAHTMDTSGVGLLVVQSGGVTVGVVSERDVVHALAEQTNLSVTRATEIASKHVVWCDDHSTVDDVAREMADNYVRHILVEHGGELVGVISARDLLAWYAESGSDLVGSVT